MCRKRRKAYIKSITFLTELIYDFHIAMLTFLFKPNKSIILVISIFSAEREEKGPFTLHGMTVPIFERYVPCPKRGRLCISHIIYLSSTNTACIYLHLSFLLAVLLSYFFWVLIICEYIFTSFKSKYFLL